MKDSKGTAATSNLYAVYRHNAETREYTFNISKDVFLALTKQNCFYCGEPPSRVHSIQYGVKPDGSKYIGYYVYNGVDRYDNTIGYNEDNCVACCFDCNRAIGDRPPEEFLAWLIKCLEHFKIKPKGG